MRRREFIASLTTAACTWPVGARAQQAMPAVGYLAVLRSDTDTHLKEAFRRGLQDAGYVEDQNVVIKFRSAQGQFDRLPDLATELIGEGVAVIVAVANASAMAAKAATAKIPIVFIGGGDPVASGLVASLNRPGGNITGVSFLINIIAAKRLELVHELVPKATAIALLVNPNNPNSAPEARDVERAARTLGLEVYVLNATSEREVEAAFTNIEQRGAGAVLVAADAFFTGQRDQLIALATRFRLPTIYSLREFVTAGGLISYGTSFIDAARQAGAYAGRILKGEKPADLPVQQSTKIELVVNLKTAKALDLAIPPSLLARADEVIE
jgi:putative tryptophan/tyrosine transport system substrate-binding protein